MKSILYILVAFNFTTFGQKQVMRSFFPEMRTEQTFVFAPDHSGCFAGFNKKIDSTRITVFFSETPFIHNAGTNYYLFTIADTANEIYVDSFLLSVKNDILSISAVKVTRTTQSGRARLNLKNVVTIPMIDLKNFSVIKPGNIITPCFLSFFGGTLSIEDNSIVKQDNETTFVVTFEYSTFGHRFRKIYFSTLRGIYKIDYF